MDRSFLSDKGLIEASRDFVCIRLATYEDSEEAEFLKKVYSGRSGNLENTVFALLSPDATKLLSRPGRAPNFAYRTPDRMVKAMELITMAYPGNPATSKIVRVPQMKNFRLSLNVASCDGLPVVAAVSSDEKNMAEMQKLLGEIAFADEFAGKFIFATTKDPKELAAISGYKSSNGYLIIQPGEYGLEGEMVEQMDENIDLATLKSSLSAYAKKTSKVYKNHSAHVRAGSEAGVMWETEIPVTDQGSLRAVERRKQGGSSSGSERGRSSGRGGGPSGR